MTQYLPSVVKAKRERGYRVRVTFDDGVEATLDFERWLRGAVFEPVKASRYFGKMFVDGGGVAWPNGADIAPETLYGAALKETRDAAKRGSTSVREKRPRYRPARKRTQR